MTPLHLKDCLLKRMVESFCLQHVISVYPCRGRTKTPMTINLSALPRKRGSAGVIDGFFEVPSETYGVLLRILPSF
jgi:hypothetical protein